MYRSPTHWLHSYISIEAEVVIAQREIAISEKHQASRGFEYYSDVKIQRIKFVLSLILLQYKNR